MSDQQAQQMAEGLKVVLFLDSLSSSELGKYASANNWSGLSALIKQQTGVSLTQDEVQLLVLFFG